MIALHNGLKRKKLIIDFIFFICIIYNSNSFFITVNSSIGFLCSLIIIIIGLYKLKFRINQSEFIIGAVLVLSVFISMFANGAWDYFGTNLRFISIIFSALVLVNIYSIHEFADIYLKWMVVLTFISLVPYCIINFVGFDSFLNKLPILKNPNGSSVYCGLVYNVYTYRQDRNMSVFWEPAVYSTYCGIAIALEVFLKDKMRIWMICVCIIGIISSVSTGGYLLLFFIFIMIINKQLAQKNLGIVWEMGVILFLLIIGLLIINNYNKVIDELYKFNPKVFYKLVSENESSSLTTRTGSAIYNLQLFWEKPILGWGLGNVDGRYVLLGGHNETSTLTYYLAAFGLPGAIYTLLWIIVIMLNRINRSISIKFILAFIFGYVLLKEPYYFSLLFYIILFSLYKCNNNEIEEQAP